MYVGGRPFPPFCGQVRGQVCAYVLGKITSKFFIHIVCASVLMLNIKNWVNGGLPHRPPVLPIFQLGVYKVLYEESGLHFPCLP